MSSSEAGNRQQVFFLLDGVNQNILFRPVCIVDEYQFHQTEASIRAF